MGFRESHPKEGPPLRPVPGLDLPVVEFYDGFCDGQAQARSRGVVAMGSGLIDPEETLEDIVQLFLGDAWTCVRYLQNRTLRARFRAELPPGLRGGVGHRVSQEIPDHPIEEIRVYPGQRLESGRAR